MTDTYTLLREIADSWVMLLMLIAFLGTWVWAFRPGSRAIHDDIAQIPFRNEVYRDGEDPNMPSAHAAPSNEDKT